MWISLAGISTMGMRGFWGTAESAARKLFFPLKGVRVLLMMMYVYFEDLHFSYISALNKPHLFPNMSLLLKLYSIAVCPLWIIEIVLMPKNAGGGVRKQFILLASPNNGYSFSRPLMKPILFCLIFCYSTFFQNEILGSQNLWFKKINASCPTK